MSSYDEDQTDPEGPSAEDLERFGGETAGCPSCRREIFDDAAFCPYCGNVLTDSRHQLGPIFAIVAGVLVVLLVLSLV